MDIASEMQGCGNLSEIRAIKILAGGGYLQQRKEVKVSEQAAQAVLRSRKRAITSPES
jgi:hypothetical protein